MNTYRTPLGDTVSTRTDFLGEHIVIECRPDGAGLALAVELELASERSGLWAYETLNARAAA